MKICGWKSKKKVKEKKRKEEKKVFLLKKHTDTIWDKNFVNEKRYFSDEATSCFTVLFKNNTFYSFFLHQTM